MSARESSIQDAMLYYTTRNREDICRQIESYTKSLKAILTGRPKSYAENMDFMLNRDSGLSLGLSAFSRLIGKDPVVLFEAIAIEVSIPNRNDISYWV